MMIPTELAGIVKNLPDPQYRAATGYGSTAIKWFLEEAPAQAKHWVDHPEDAPTFAGSEIGTLVHALVLDQPHPYVVKDWDARTKEGKERAAEVEAEGLIGVTAGDFDIAKGCAEGALRHPTLRAILERPGSGECSVFAEIDGVRVKARFDYLPEPSDRRLVAVDLKSAFSANPVKFTKNVATFDYAVQHGHYLDVLNAVMGPMPYGMEPELLFAAIDKRPPHLVSLIGLPMIWAQIGREKAARARQIIRDGEATGVWPAFGDDIHYIEAPQWYLYAAEGTSA